MNILFNDVVETPSYKGSKDILPAALQLVRLSCLNSG